MNAEQLESFALNDPFISLYFRGVLPSNWLSKQACTLGGDSSYIANTDPASKPGEHWVAFYFDAKAGRVEVFDSFAVKSLHIYDRTWDKWVRKAFCRSPPPTLLTNNHVIQSDSSDVCGIYCLYYLYERSRGKSFANIVSAFSTRDKQGNDRKIISWWRRHRYRNSDAHVGGQICCSYGNWQNRHPYTRQRRR